MRKIFWHTRLHSKQNNVCYASQMIIVKKDSEKRRIQSPTYFDTSINLIPKLEKKKT